MQNINLYLLLLLIPAIVISQRPPIPDGFYKIVNVADGNVLTATMSPKRPRIVITAPWSGADEQEWKVKTKIVDGNPLEIIRNEKIRDNEVTKEINRDKTSNKNDYIQTLWNLITVGKRGRPEGFELNSGIYCLKSEGRGKEVKHVDCVDSAEEDVDKSYLWRFEYLFDIPSAEPTVEMED